MRPFDSIFCGEGIKALLVLAISVVIATGCALPVAAQDDDEEFVQEGLIPSETKKSDSDPVKLFLEGQKAHEQGDLDKALELYSKAIAVLPEFPEAEYQRGMIYQARGMDREAEASFRKAVDYRRDWTLAMSSLGKVLIRNGKLVEARQVLEKAIRLDSLSFPAYIALTDLYLLENPAESVLRKLYSSLVYLTTKSHTPASIWACRGSFERVFGQIDEAKKSILRSLALDPGNSRALIEEIEIALAESDAKGAKALSAAYLKLHPKSKGAKILLARSSAQSGDRTDAIRILESITDPDKQTKQLLAALKANGDAKPEELERELKDDPENIWILGSLCRVLRVDDPAKALRYCEKAYKLERKNIGHAVGFGAALVQLRQFGRAINLFEEIKRRVPDNYTVRANLATAYIKARDFEKAKVEYVWITTTKPELAAGYYFLAITHDNLREYIDAMANYQKFIRLADKKEFANEIDRVRLRIPLLQKQIDRGRGRKKGG